jgi:guanylate kinase
LIEDENFVEYSEHYNYFYGTSALEIDNCIRDGENLYIKAINVDGALQLKRDLGRKAIVIYLDSSLNEIKRRMLKRDGSLVSKRVDAYVRENSLKIWFDLIIDTKNPQQTLEIAVDFLKEKLNLGKEESDLCDTDELMKKLTGISMEQAQNMSIEELNNVLGSKELTEEEFSILSSDLDSRWNAI